MNDTNLHALLDHAEQLNHHLEIVSRLKTGKEAELYQVLLDGNLVAMKLYKDQAERAFKNTGDYLQGTGYRKTSHRKAIEKKNAFSKKLIHDNWITREFSLLKKLYALDAPIPKPIEQIDNAIFMEYLGDEQHAASRLSDCKLSPDEAQHAFDTIIKAMHIFWDAGIVHADLSPYNILWWDNKPYIIDFPQAINRLTHPDAKTLLDRDIFNIYTFFKKMIPIDIESIKKTFKTTNETHIPII